MKLISYALKQDLYDYISNLPLDVKVSPHKSNDGTWCLEIQMNDETESVLYYLYHAQEYAEHDFNQLTNFLNHIYHVV